MTKGKTIRGEWFQETPHRLAAGSKTSESLARRRDGRAGGRPRAPTVNLLSVTSNEPDDAPGKADGSTVNDIVIVDDDTVKLRAERNVNGTGRIYTLTYRATDGCGNQTTRTATVTVPIG